MDLGEAYELGNCKTAWQLSQNVLECEYWEERKTALHDACASGYLSMVKLLLQSGSHVDAQDRGGRTPLMFAVDRGHDEVALQLIRAGASLTAKNKLQQTALYYGSKGGGLSVVRTLIEAGASINEQDWNGTTPLMFAADGGHDCALHELIGSGASATAKDMWQSTALHYASKGGHPSVISTLIEAGANIDEQDECGWTPLMEAVEGGHDQVVHELIRAGATVTAKNKRQRTALHYASKGSHSSVVKVLIEAGAVINEHDEGGRTPLMDAADKGCDKVVHELIQAGASVMVKNKHQQTSLHLASKGGHANVVRTISEAGANVNEQDEGGRTPLMDAAEWGHTEVALELIRAGATVTDFSSHPTIHMGDWSVAADSTALHFAAAFNNLKTECGVLLMEAGADMTIRNRDSKSPLDIASSQFQQAIQQVPSVSTKRIVAVIGNTKNGKSTLIAALQAEANSRWKKFTNSFPKVRNIRRQTTGIEVIQFSSQKYGETLFYDFAGQSKFHGPHQCFLEAMLSKPGAPVTLLLVVKATQEEGIIRQQIAHWLQPLALMSVSASPQVIIVGSFLDRVRSRGEATRKLLRCTQSVQEEFPFNIRGPCLLNCRKADSDGIRQICTFFQQTWMLQLNSNSLSYNLHWVLVQMKRAFSIPAITFDTFQSWLLDEAKLLLRCIAPPEKVCHDLTVVGHALFLANKRDYSQSWLILDLQAILHNVYGTLFSGSQGKVNKYGLLCCSQLAVLFPGLDQAMIQEVLTSLEFCIQVDPLLMREELLKLTAKDEKEGWLYFPACVSAQLQPTDVFPNDPDPSQFQCVCWQLRTAEKHFISAHLIQTIILRVAANHVFTHKLPPSVREHCFNVWVNGLSWRTINGVDIAVQISNSSVVQVVGCSKAGPEKLHQYMSTIARDVIQSSVQLSPKLEATSYIICPLRYTPTMWEDIEALPLDSLYPISNIVRCISDRNSLVLSLPRQTGCLPQQVSLTELFGGWSPSLSVVEDMDFKKEPQSGKCVLPLMEL